MAAASKLQRQSYSIRGNAVCLKTDDVPRRLGQVEADRVAQAVVLPLQLVPQVDRLTAQHHNYGEPCVGLDRQQTEPPIDVLNLFVARPPSPDSRSSSGKAARQGGISRE